MLLRHHTYGLRTWCCRSESSGLTSFCLSKMVRRCSTIPKHFVNCRHHSATLYARGHDRHGKENVPGIVSCSPVVEAHLLSTLFIRLVYQDAGKRPVLFRFTTPQQRPAKVSTTTRPATAICRIRHSIRRMRRGQCLTSHFATASRGPNEAFWQRKGTTDEATHPVAGLGQIHHDWASSPSRASAHRSPWLLE